MTRPALPDVPVLARVFYHKRFVNRFLDEDGNVVENILEHVAPNDLLIFRNKSRPGGEKQNCLNPRAFRHRRAKAVSVLLYHDFCDVCSMRFSCADTPYSPDEWCLGCDYHAPCLCFERKRKCCLGP